MCHYNMSKPTGIAPFWLSPDLQCCLIEADGAAQIQVDQESHSACRLQLYAKVLLKLIVHLLF